MADHDPVTLRRYRVPTSTDLQGLAGVKEALASEPPFAPGLPAVPDEPLSPTLAGLIGAAGFGYDTWGKLCNPRQTLDFVRLSRVINELSTELREAGISEDYRAALTGYAVAGLGRRLKRSTRGAMLGVVRQDVWHVYAYGSSIRFSFDYFEIGIGTGSGTWDSLSRRTLWSLKKQLDRPPARPATILRGSALEPPIPDGRLDAVVTDPPYDKMLNYCDASDLMFVWMKRALASSMPWFSITGNPHGLQEKTDEVVVARVSGGDPRTKERYAASIARAFDQARRKTRADGVVTIVFGHGDPDAWMRVIAAIAEADLVLTGSWPCSTEKGGRPIPGDNIDNTIVMAARSAEPGRPVGRLPAVSEEIREEIALRIPIWRLDGLVDSDQRMAAIAPAMEVVGRYREVLDITGQPVPIEHFLGLAHRAVDAAADILIDRFRLADFDARTRFALSWARQHGRDSAPGSKARWLRLSYNLADSEAEGILVREGRRRRLVYADEVVPQRAAIDRAAIDLALGVANVGCSVGDVADLVARSGGRSNERMWAVMGELVKLVGESDRDGRVWAWAVRNQTHIEGEVAQRGREQRKRQSVEGARISERPHGILTYPTA